jgi:protein ImuA
MRLISCHDGKLLTLDADQVCAAGRGGFVTGLGMLDDLLPGGAFSRGAVHELLTEPANPQALAFAVLLAKGAIGGGAEDSSTPTALIWCDPAAEIYPPALAAAGIPPERVYFLRPGDAARQAWAVAECLRCKGVGAVVAAPQRLSRTEARKLQLSAERGGGVGLLLRTFGQTPHYAAATRWLIRPSPGERTVQRWNIQLLHAPGGRVGESVLLQMCRQTQRMTARKEVEEKTVRVGMARAS